VVEKNSNIGLAFIVIFILISGTFLFMLAPDTGSAVEVRQDPIENRLVTWADGGPLNSFKSIDFSKSGKICAASTDKSIIIFDLKTGANLHQIPLNQFNGADVGVVDINDDGRFILAVDSSNWVYIIAATNATIVFKYSMNLTVTTGSISGSGEYFGLGSGEPYSQNYMTVFRNPAWKSARAYSNSPVSLDETGDSTRAGRSNHSGPLLAINYNNLITSIDFSFNGSAIVAGSWDKTVRLYSITNSTPRWIFNADNVTTSFVSINKVNSVDITPDGTGIAAGLESGIVILSSASSDPTNFWSTEANGTATVSISDDGKIITSGGNNIVVINSDSSVPVWLYHLQNGTITMVRQSSDGKRIAVIGQTLEFDSLIMFFNYAENMPVWIHRYSSVIEDLEFTGDGTHLGILSRSIPVISIFETVTPGPDMTLDSDGDRMADAWELANGLNISIDDAYVDSDGDLFANIAEFEAGTDPWMDTDFPGSSDDSYKHLTPNASKRNYRDPYGDVRFIKYKSSIQDFEDRGTDISLYREVDILNLTSLRLNETLKVKLELARKPELTNLENDIQTESTALQQSGSDNSSSNQNATGGPDRRSNTRSSFTNLAKSKVFYSIYFVTANFTEQWDLTSGQGSFEPDEKLSDTAFIYTVSNQSGLSAAGTPTTTVKLDRKTITWTIPLGEISYLPADFEIFAAAWFATGDPADIILNPEDVAIVYDSAGYGSAELDKTKYPLRTIKEFLDGREVNIDFQGTGYLNLKSITELELPDPAKLRESIGVYIDIDLVNGSLTDAEIRIGYDETDLAGEDESDLKLFYWDDASGEWIIIPNSGVYPDNNTVWGKVDHFTIFAPMAETPTDTGAGEEGDGDGFSLPSIFGLSIIIWIVIGIALVLVFGVTGMVYRRRGHEPVRKPDYIEDDKDFKEMYDESEEDLGDDHPDLPPGRPRPPRPGTPQPPIRKGKPDSKRRTPPPPPPPESAVDEGGISWDDDDDEEEDEEEEEEEELDTMPCPKCGTTVTIPSKERPVTVECQDCGARGKLK
jgi:WD40 repeat protein